MSCTNCVILAALVTWKKPSRKASSDGAAFGLPLNHQRRRNMKKAIFLAIALVLCGAAYMIADTTFSWSVPDQSGTLTYVNLALTTPVIDGAAPFTEADAAQSDTNATTTATGYTPAFIGQVLTGSAGSGTNAVWISSGTTTNDWNLVTN